MKKFDFKAFAADVLDYWGNSDKYSVSFYKNHIEFNFNDYMGFLFIYNEEQDTHSIFFNNFFKADYSDNEDVYSSLELDDIKEAYNFYQKLEQMYEANCFEEDEDRTEDDEDTWFNADGSFNLDAYYNSEDDYDDDLEEDDIN